MFDFFKAGWQRSVRLKDADLFPLAHGTRPPEVLGGVRHKDLPEAFHQRRGKGDGSEGTVISYLAAQPAPMKRLSGHGLYAGPFFRHFGHFIAESAHRLWAWTAGDGPYDYIAVLPQVPRGHPYPTEGNELAGFQRQVLGYMGVPLDRVVTVQEPVTADDLTVPLQASMLGNRVYRAASYVDFWATHEAKFYASHTGTLPKPADKIYVSRSNFLSQGSFAGERYLEDQLAADGFMILRPETIPLVDQLHYYRNARLLVFAEGSAIHTTELLGPMKADIVCLQRSKGSTDLWQSVLAGRSHQLAFFDMVTPLPALEARHDGAPAGRKALSLLNGAELVRYFRGTGYAKLASFDQDRFHLMEAADIARYVVNARMMHTYKQNQTTELLKAFKAALMERDNPYLKETL